MKRGLVLILTLLPFGLWAQGSSPLISLDTNVVDSFNGDGIYIDGANEGIQWTVNGVGNATEGFPRTTVANVWPSGKYGDAPANTDELQSFAINGSFTRRGRNSIEIIPTRDGSTPDPLPLADEVKALGVWVWGSNFNQHLVAIIEDADGTQHRLDMGSLQFMGWRNLSVVMPSNINQGNRTFPLRRTLRLVKFVVEINQSEQADNFFLYMHGFTSISQRRFMTGFDGSNLTEQSVLERVWDPQETRTDAGQPGNDTSTADFQKLQEIQVSTMSDPSYWQARMNSDDGRITLRSFEGGPSDRVPLEGDENDAETANRVLGARINFVRRSRSQFTIKPVRPFYVEGVTKVVSVWVAGRNAAHELQLVVRDFNGNRRVLSMGTLDFSGWKQMSVSIPENIVQTDTHYPDRAGMIIDGFIVRNNLVETSGTFFVYLDDLRALVDVFAVTTGRATDDPTDNW